MAFTQQKALLVSKQTLRFGLALLTQGICFHLLHWEGPFVLMISGSAFLLIAFLLRLPFRKTLGNLSVFRSFAMFCFGIRMLFITQHLWGSQAVEAVTAVILVLWIFLEVGYSEKNSSWNMVLGLKIWIAFIVFALFVGSLFKIQHWPGADMAWLFGFQSLSLIFLVMAKNPRWGIKRTSE